MQKVAVVILNYNGKNWLEKFLPNVIEFSSSSNVEIIVADNASTDDSFTFLKENFPNIKRIQLSINTGYAGGYNNALAQIDSDYYVLLNSDVEVTENWIQAAINYLESDPLLAACQPKLLSYNNKTEFEYAGAAGGFIDKYGYPFCRGRIFDTCEKDEGQYNQSGEVFWATGACLFIKAKLFHLAGGFDADFFAHMEEIDLCWRLKNLGYKIGYCAESTVYHVGGGTLDKTNPKKVFLNFRNNRKLLRKNMAEAELKAIYPTRNILDRIAAVHAVLTGQFARAKSIRRALKEYKKQITKLNTQRDENGKKQVLNAIGKPNMTGIYQESIVINYYINGIKKFSDLLFSSPSNS